MSFSIFASSFPAKVTFGTSIVTFEILGQILKITLPQKNGHRLKTSSSINDLGVILFETKNSIPNNAYNIFNLLFAPSFSKLLTECVAFFVGHPV